MNYSSNVPPERPTKPSDEAIKASDGDFSVRTPRRRNVRSVIVVIIALSYAYALVVVDPDRIADEMARRGNFIPGVRPGADTAKLIRKVISDVTLPGALFMAVLAIVPQVLFYLIGNPLLSVLGGTSLLIIVGVAVNISASLEGEAANGAYADYVTEV